MPTITEFLEARIAEDEARARDFEHAQALTMNGDYGNYDAIYTAPSNWAALERIGFTPERVLDESAAKRAVMREHAGMVEAVERLSAALPGDLNQEPDAYWRTATLYHLAAVYADHPDYDAAWVL